MILKASQRGGGTQLGIHLLKTENEHVEVHEVSGFCAEDVLGAMKEAQAVARGTRCKRFLFSLSLSPPETASVGIDVFEAALDRIERETGLAGQPRIVVFHEKQGRRHAHAVWSRIDAQTMTAKPLPFFKSKLHGISKSLFLEHGWTLPRGFINKEQRDMRNFDLAEWQQIKRLGSDPCATKEAVQESWSRSNDQASFETALEGRGLYLARGDRRGHVAVTIEGEVLSLSRLTGRKTKEIEARVGKPEQLRSVDETKLHIATAIAPKLRRLIKDNARAEAAELEPLEAQRTAMRDQHREARREIDQGHRERSQAEALARTARLRKGVAGLWDRLTGRRKETLRQNEAEAVQCRTRDRLERQDLVRGQLEERRGLQREIVAVRMRYIGPATELHRDYYRQNPSHQPDNLTLSEIFDGFSGASGEKLNSPRNVRGQSARRSRGRDGLEL